MVVTLFVVFLIAVSGSVLTHFYSAEEKFLVRLCAGNVIGSAIFALVGFLLCCALKMSVTTVLLALAVALLPLVLLVKNGWRGKFFTDLKNLFVMNPRKWFDFVFYAAIIIFLYFFFTQSMIEKPQGIFTGSSHNTGDLPFHLGAIFSFTDGQNFPPENPSYAFAKFTYPFMTDLVTAFFVKLGASVRDAIVWQDVTLGFSLLVLFENFAYRLTKNARAGKLAVIILMFSGGLGFAIFFRDYWHDGRALSEFIWHLPGDYTIRETGVRWGNPLTTLFLTQRSLLLGMPITLIVLTYLWKVFTTQTPRRGDAETEESEIKGESEIADNGLRGENSKSTTVLSRHLRVSASPFFIGLLAGNLPLVHVHSLAVLFVASAFLFFFSPGKWRLWLAFGLATMVIAVPELAWAMTGSATRLTQFVDWNFGWDARGSNVFVFWARNLGLFFPLLLLGFYFAVKSINANQKDSPQKQKETGNEETENGKRRTENLGFQIQSSPFTICHLYFYLPFLLCFVVSNLIKLAPWEWDNIKVLIYWFVASVPFVAWVLAILWEKGLIYKISCAACLIILTLSGAIDVWRVISGQVSIQIFNRDGAAVAEQIKQRTAPNALFLNAPTYNSAVVLSGRRSLMRYSGHLSSYGIDYEPRELELRRIYEGSALAADFLKKNNIEYVLISPEERADVDVNDEFFSRFPVVAEAGDYRVYQVKK